MELRNFIRVILRGWWLVIPAVLISVVTGLIVTFSQTPIYRSTATFVVSPSASLEEFSSFMRSLDALNKRDNFVSTYSQIAASRTVRGSVYGELGLTPAQIRNLNVSAELIPATNIIQVTVESDDPVIAKSVADLVGEKTIEYVEDLYEPYDMKPLDRAFVPPLPSKPLLVRNLIVAAILGMVVGVGSAFVLENLRLPQKVIAGVNIIDGDTGIYNRYYFMQRLGEELSRANRHERPLSLAMMNIEHLDTVGDVRLPRLRSEALRRAAFFLKEDLREEDLIARYEGDKFAFLLPDTSGPDAKQILRKLKDRLELNTFELEGSGVKLNLTASSGIATYLFNGAGRNELLSHAEEALQRASDGSGGRTCLYGDDCEDEIDEKMNADRQDAMSEA